MGGYTNKTEVKIVISKCAGHGRVYHLLEAAGGRGPHTCVRERGVKRKVEDGKGNRERGHPLWGQPGARSALPWLGPLG